MKLVVQAYMMMAVAKVITMSRVVEWLEPEKYPYYLSTPSTPPLRGGGNSYLSVVFD
ncbi:MAG: hypothetical protein QXK12_08150 [Candidatus Nezhaarchaeales archaeon]